MSKIKTTRTPVMPTVGWDSRGESKIGHSQPAVHIWAEKGDWKHRGTKRGGPVPRRQQYKG